MKTFSVNVQHSQIIIPVSIAPTLLIPGFATHFNVKALLDTGAVHTAIRADIPLRLGLRPIAKVVINSATYPMLCYQYYIRITLPEGLYIDNRVTALPLSNQPIHCLIGMDVLKYFTMIYDGRNGLCSLTLQSP